VSAIHCPAHAIKTAPEGWARFWTGRLDLDALALDVTEHLRDLVTAQARIDRATGQTKAYWERLFGDDEAPVLAGPSDGSRRLAVMLNAARRLARCSSSTPSNQPWKVLVGPAIVTKKRQIRGSMGPLGTGHQNMLASTPG